MIRLIIFCIAIFFVPIKAIAELRLNFPEVVHAALNHAFDIRLSALDIGISRTAHQQAKAAYYPELSTRFNSQYVRDLTGGTPQVTAVGTTILLQNTIYQSSLSMNANVNLYDFGSRELKVMIAEKDIQVKQVVYAQALRDTKLRVLEIYRDLLLTSRELKSKKALLDLYKELVLTKERLFLAGKILKIEMMDEAIKVVKTLDALDNLKLKITNILEDLSLSTGIKYAAEGLEVEDFRDQETIIENRFDIKKSPEFRMYELEIEKKTAELESIKRDRYLPQFSFYSNYIFYGEDKKYIDASLGGMQSRNFFLGVQATLPLFDGFRSSAQIEKAKIEIVRLKVEKEKKLTQLMSRYDKLEEVKKYYLTGIKNQDDLTAKVSGNLFMMGRLTAQQIAEHPDWLNRKIEMNLQQLELDKMTTLKKAADIELRLLSES
jgi:outer membrane protein TolC